MERHGGEVSHSETQQPNWSFENNRENSSGDFHHNHHHQERPYQHRHHNQLEPSHQLNSFPDSNCSVAGEGVDSNVNHSLPAWTRKRHFPSEDGLPYVKLYVVGVPRTTAEEEIRSIFGEHGHIVEVFILRDKRTGQQHESCFVKYSSVEEADRALEALNNQNIFPGAPLPLKVRYADGERERLGNMVAGQVFKLYVGSLNRQASKGEIEEIFTPFGVVEDVFIVRDEMKQSRGFAFVQFSRREMALAAINALNGSFTMRGCDQPLRVRFAAPKKPRIGEFMPRPFMNGPMNGYNFHNNQQSPQSKGQMDECIDCEWSEHICPDGDAYYYNCITYESRWEKPEEYAVYEQQFEQQQL